MKVISWNIFNGQAANPTLTSPDLADSIRATVAQMGCDLLAVQEVDEKQPRS
jgi:endonuclease/exonuclease/phosphatase family metal-dependent hydrolase